MEDRTGLGSANAYLKKSAWIGVSLLLVIVCFGIYTRWHLRQQRIPDIFDILRDQGYTANVGFSGVFRPGNVVQIAESGRDGEARVLVTPIVFLWGADCFPGATPRTDPFVLPQSRGTSRSSLSIGADALTKLVPALQMDSSAIVDFMLQVHNPRVHTLAKGDLSGRFSEACVDAFDRQIKAGDQPDWFAIILDAIVAEKLAFEVNWSDDTTAAARAKVTREAEEAFSQLLETANSGGESPDVSVYLDNESREQTVIAAEGPVILGYRARLLQRQYDE